MRSGEGLLFSWADLEGGALIHCEWASASRASIDGEDSRASNDAVATRGEQACPAEPLDTTRLDSKCTASDAGRNPRPPFRPLWGASAAVVLRAPGGARHAMAQHPRRI